jgi:hypothetical protein
MTDDRRSPAVPDSPSATTTATGKQLPATFTLCEAQLTEEDRKQIPAIAHKIASAKG